MSCPMACKNQASRLISKPPPELKWIIISYEKRERKTVGFFFPALEEYSAEEYLAIIDSKFFRVIDLNKSPTFPFAKHDKNSILPQFCQR